MVLFPHLLQAFFFHSYVKWILSIKHQTKTQKTNNWENISTQRPRETEKWLLVMYTKSTYCRDLGVITIKQNTSNSGSYYYYFLIKPPEILPQNVAYISPLSESLLWSFIYSIFPFFCTWKLLCLYQKDTNW